MHELGIVSEVLDVVLLRAEALGVRRILEVHLILGEGAGLSDDVFLYHWDAAVAGTVAEGARVTLERTPDCPGIRLGSIVVERCAPAEGSSPSRNHTRRRSRGEAEAHRESAAGGSHG